MERQILSLVGMSGVGKSHLARALEARGSVRLECDARIAQRLPDLLGLSAKDDPVHALGRWMGMPWTAGYAEREARYLALEEDVTREALDRASACAGGAHPVVIDCTGSVIHLSEALRARLSAETRVVHLATPRAREATLLARYLARPRPIVWASAWRPSPGEPPERALERLYPELLRAREERYRALAARSIDAAWLEAASLDETLAALRGAAR